MGKTGSVAQKSKLSYKVTILQKIPSKSDKMCRKIIVTQNIFWTTP